MKGICELSHLIVQCKPEAPRHLATSAHTHFGWTQFHPDMRVVSSLLFICICIEATGQQVTGNYQDFFGHRLELKGDSTFRVEWRFDLINSWSIGTWSRSDRTIELTFVSVFDTLERIGVPDSLVLSIDEQSNRIGLKKFQTSLLISGGQSQEPFPETFGMKGKRLYLINENGKIDKKRRSGIWPQKKWPFGTKKWPSWYYKPEAEDTTVPNKL